VQFCNLNQYDENFAEDIIRAVLADGTINATDYRTPANYLDAANEYFRAQLIRKSLNGEFNIALLAFDISQMLISCRFKDEPCSRNDFMEYFDYYYGLCYRFNQGKNLSGHDSSVASQGIGGIKYGLRLELYAGQAQTQEKYMMARGFRILVFNKSNVNQIAREVGIDVATGLNTNIAVERTLSAHLGAPYGSCLPIDISQLDWKKNDVLKFMYDNLIDGSYYKPIDPNTWLGPQWTWTLTYDEFFCLKMCFQKYLYENCGCYDITLPMTPKNQATYINNACSTGAQLKCMKAKQSYFYSQSDLFGPCYSKCPIECEQIKYDLKVTQSVYPTEWYADLLSNSTVFNEVINKYFNTLNKTNISYQSQYASLKNSVAMVNVYYEDLSYVMIDESPAMSFDVFLGSLGGNMDLFMGNFQPSNIQMISFIYSFDCMKGMSLLTVTELIEVFYMVIALQVKKAMLKKKAYEGGNFDVSTANKKNRLFYRE
jgi:hypothetical protein